MRYYCALQIFCLIKCTSLLCRPEFQDDPHEIAEQVWFTYEDEDDKDSLEVKKEEIPVTLWMCEWIFNCLCALHCIENL